MVKSENELSLIDYFIEGLYILVLAIGIIIGFIIGVLFKALLSYPLTV